MSNGKRNPCELHPHRKLRTTKAGNVYCEGCLHGDLDTKPLEREEHEINARIESTREQLVTVAHNEMLKAFLTDNNPDRDERLKGLALQIAEKSLAVFDYMGKTDGRVVGDYIETDQVILEGYYNRVDALDKFFGAQREEAADEKPNRD